MIAIDSSALVAIATAEPERRLFIDLIAKSGGCASSVTILETRIVILSRFGLSASADLEFMLEALSLEIVAFDAAQSRRAFEAFQVYGKGMHAAARLNFGDCASYALSKQRGIPLLFKGTDFTATDIVAAV